MPRPTSWMAATSRPGDDDTLIRIWAPSRASSWGAGEVPEVLADGQPEPDPEARWAPPAGGRRRRRSGARRTGRRSAGRPCDGRGASRPSSSSAAAMNSRWSADSSTNETTADRPSVSAAERRQARIVEPHRDLGGEVLEQVAGQAELGEDDQAGAAGARLGEQRRGGARGCRRGAPSRGAIWARAMRSGCARPESTAVADDPTPSRRAASDVRAAPAGLGRGRRDGWRRGRRRAGRGRDTGRRRAADAGRGGRGTARGPAGRLDLLGRARDLLGEVAGDLVATRQRRAAPDPRSCSARGCRAARAASSGCGSGSRTAGRPGWARRRSG